MAENNRVILSSKTGCGSESRLQLGLRGGAAHLELAGGQHLRPLTATRVAK